MQGQDSWIEAFQAGDERIFQEIDESYRNAILRFVSQRIPDRDTALDVTQEIFIKAFRFRARYSSEYAFSTWLWTIARNTVLDSFRRDKQDDHPDEDEENAFICPLPNAEELLLQKGEKRRRLLKFLRALSGQQKRILWMRLVHQLSYEEIARKLGLSLSAVKCAVYRSKQNLAWA